jgi:peroxiredoxin
LDFWATWRERHVHDTATLQTAHELFEKKGLVVIGVHHHSAHLEQVRKFAADHKLTFPIALDSANGETISRYTVSAWPPKVLVGRDGRVIYSDSHGDLLAAVRRAVLYGDASGQ